MTALSDRVRWDTDIFVPRVGIDALSPSDWWTITLIAKGLLNKEIAEQMGCNEQTVKNRITIVLTKLGVRNRIEILIAVGWIAIPESAL